MSYGGLLENQPKTKLPGGVLKTKIIITIVILMIGCVATITFNGVGSNATQYQAEGLIIEFDHYNTVWTEADYNEYATANDLTDYACNLNGYSFLKNVDGKIVELNGISDTSEKSWDLWIIGEGTDFKKTDDYSHKNSGCKAIVWAYCEENDKPTIALDASGTSFYGYAQAQRIVTLSPVCTEIVASMKAVSHIVGTDSYSNYPETIVTEKKNKNISVVGTYTDPSYEAIIHENPDIVFCDGSQYNHKQISNKLRSSDINAVLLKNGETIETILDNIFMIGTAMGYNMRAHEVITQLNEAISDLSSLVDGMHSNKVMISLSTDPSPWIAGDKTYFSDIVETMGSTNTYSDITGWALINAEWIGTNGGSQYDSDVIFVVTNSKAYSATQESYDEMVKYLPENWKSTSAYQNGKIYLLCESFGEMAQRSGPRFAQLSEIVARAISPDSFTDSVELPLYIGDDYKEYLTITSKLGYEG